MKPFDFPLLADAYKGIIYLRPGHVSSRFVLEIIAAVQASNADLTAPFIVVAERKGSNIRVRVRQNETP